LRGVDEAMRARLSLVPFTVTIPVERRDKRLKERLKAEWPAILRWMINGCLAWQKDGLKPPEAVTAASDAYFDQQDSLAMWLDERTENGKPDENALSSVLYQSWRAWAEARNEFVGTNKRFSEAMEARGYRKNKTMAGAAFYAIKLKQVEARQEDVRSSRYPDA
jgi:phage/plasmid-associated DNA primase